jgi:hypothetical protein
MPSWLSKLAHSLRPSSEAVPGATPDVSLFGTDSEMSQTSKQKAPGCFDRALSAITDVENFVQLGWEGLQNALHGPETIKILRDSHREETREKYRDEGLLRRAEKLRDFARKQGDSGFSYLHGLAVVRLWTILEALVEELALERLSDPEQTSRFPEVRELEGPLLGFAAADSAERASILLELLTHKLRAKLGPGIGRFEQLLQAVHFGGPVNPSVRRALLELWAVRNLIVHRSGMVDARFAELCAWLHVKVGEPLIVPHSRVGAYAAACAWYVFELARRDECERLAAGTGDQNYFQGLLDVQTKMLSRLDAAPNPDSLDDA